MADEERFLDDDVTGEAEQPSGGRPSFLPAIFITVLKWAAIGLAAIIVVATISWATFRLFIQGRTPTGVAEFSPEYQQLDLRLEYFSNQLDNIRGQTSDEPPLSFLAALSLGYLKGKTAVQTELIDKNELIQNTILIFLGRKNATELRTSNLVTLQEELKTLLNNSIIRTGQIVQVTFKELQTF
jgi:flagellar basal body-associated protein FliL